MANLKDPQLTVHELLKFLGNFPLDAPVSLRTVSGTFKAVTEFEVHEMYGAEQPVITLAEVA